ncbi:hypothetical protein PFDG_05152 [Plasmodium falciparum Dd2]|uniref:Uncharacterized protein n=1 Tax=Plasmodium falciparum (isolate Dd2) TaxID=57267 RepID=A0A0L7M9V1_PLAF4|nr:hypothetical protein PFDG_05152 [Plasmodium falciparum Dd2]
MKWIKHFLVKSLIMYKEYKKIFLTGMFSKYRNPVLVIQSEEKVDLNETVVSSILHDIDMTKDVLLYN